MALIKKHSLVESISPPLDHLLATQMLDEFVSMERRYIQRDWEPSELDGGQFCEVLSRVLYHMDSGNLNQGKPFDECLRYLENDQLSHSVTPRRHALHLARVLRTIYKFRSQRGAVHITPSYAANHMDSKFVIEAVRWCMNETLRIFWKDDRERVAQAIRELLQFDVPAIGVFEDVTMVQRTDLSAEEEILVLLHYAGEAGYTRMELGQHCMCPRSTVTDALRRLTTRGVRQVICTGGGRYRLTDIGARRLREQLADKLLLQ